MASAVDVATALDRLALSRQYHFSEIAHAAYRSQKC